MTSYRSLSNFLLRTKQVYSLLFICCVFVFTLHYISAGMAVYGDGIDYYAYLHTVYFDQDITFENEFQHFHTYESNNVTNSSADYIMKTRVLPNGKVENIHPPGTAILLSPFYILGDLMTFLFNLTGFTVLRNGYANLYQISVGVGSILYMLGGLLLTERILNYIIISKRAKREIQLLVRLAVLTIFLSTSLFFYGAIDVINSHAVSFFLVQLLLSVLLMKSLSEKKLALACGIIIGLATMCRPQDILLFVIYFSFLFFHKSSKFDKRKVYSIMTSTVIISLAFLVTIFPMVYIWHDLYGGWFRIGYVFEAPMTDVLGSFTHTTNGLFSRTPILLLSLLALPLLWKKYRFLLLTFILFFILNFIVINRHGGWAFPAYGGRMYMVTFFIFFLLLTELFLYLKKKRFSWLIWAIAVGFPIANMFSILSFMAFEKEAFGNKRGIEGETKERLKLLLPPVIHKYLLRE